MGEIAVLLYARRGCNVGDTSGTIVAGGSGIVGDNVGVSVGGIAPVFETEGTTVGLMEGDSFSVIPVGNKSIFLEYVISAAFVF